MSWSSPATAIAGSVLTAAWLNTYLRDNMLVLRAGGFSLSTQASGALMVATSSTQWGLIASPNDALQVLLGTNPPSFGGIPLSRVDAATGTTSATNSNVWTVAIPALTDKDSLLVFLTVHSTGGNDAASFYSTTDSATLSTTQNGNALGSAYNTIDILFLRHQKTGNAQVAAIDLWGGNGGSGLVYTSTNCSWAAGFTFALRSGASNGGFDYDIAVYKVAGQ